MTSYKELIREQDQQLVEMRKQLEGMGGERDSVLTSSKEQSEKVETLLKQNAELKQLLERSKSVDCSVEEVLTVEKCRKNDTRLGGSGGDV